MNKVVETFDQFFFTFEILKRVYGEYDDFVCTSQKFAEGMQKSFQLH